MSQSEVELDPMILICATLPIIIVVGCASIIRSNMLMMFKDSPNVDMKHMKHNNVLSR